MKNNSIQGLTLIEAIVTLVVLIIVISILLAVLAQARINTREMQTNVQLRGIHQAFITHATSNNGYFAGLNGNGEIVSLIQEENEINKTITTEARFDVLLKENSFTGEYLISPAERLNPWTTGQLTADQYSFALPSITDPGGRRDEWRDTLNPKAPIVSDRNIGGPAPLESRSIQYPNANHWQGSVAWNDNHAGFESTAFLTTAFGDPPIENQNDYLFAADSPDDALQIHSGE